MKRKKAVSFGLISAVVAVVFLWLNNYPPQNSAVCERMLKDIHDHPEQWMISGIHNNDVLPFAYNYSLTRMSGNKLFVLTVGRALFVPYVTLEAKTIGNDTALKFAWQDWFALRQAVHEFVSVKNTQIFHFEEAPSADKQQIVATALADKRFVDIQSKTDNFQNSIQPGDLLTIAKIAKEHDLLVQLGSLRMVKGHVVKSSIFCGLFTAADVFDIALMAEDSSCHLTCQDGLTLGY